jgi:glutaredoxin 3
MDIKIYGTEACPYCVLATKLCESKKLKYEKIDLTKNKGLQQKLSKENDNYRTVPMIFIDDIFIGGYSELQKVL